jgi:hypothetical protein
MGASSSTLPPPPTNAELEAGLLKAAQNSTEFLGDDAWRDATLDRLISERLLEMMEAGLDLVMRSHKRDPAYSLFVKGARRALERRRELAAKDDHTYHIVDGRTVFFPDTAAFWNHTAIVPSDRQYRELQKQTQAVLASPDAVRTFHRRVRAAGVPTDDRESALRDTLLDYEDDGFRDANEGLRRSTLTSRGFQICTGVVTILDTLPKTSGPLRLYRGVGSNDNRWKKGEVFVDKGFSSKSTSLSTAIEFALKGANEHTINGRALLIIDYDDPDKYIGTIHDHERELVTYYGEALRVVDTGFTLARLYPPGSGDRQEIGATVHLPTYYCAHVKYAMPGLETLLVREQHSILDVFDSLTPGTRFMRVRNTVIFKAGPEVPSIPGIESAAGAEDVRVLMYTHDLSDDDHIEVMDVAPVFTYGPQIAYTRREGEFHKLCRVTDDETMARFLSDCAFGRVDEITELKKLKLLPVPKWSPVSLTAPTGAPAEAGPREERSTLLNLVDLLQASAE